MENILKEIRSELTNWAYSCSMLGDTTYEDGIYEGLKIAEKIVKKEIEKNGKN